MVKAAQTWFSIEDVSLNQPSEWCDSLLPLVSPDATWHLRNRWRHVASALESLAVKLLVLMSRAQKSGYNVFSILNLILNAIGILENSTWCTMTPNGWLMGWFTIDFAAFVLVTRYPAIIP